MTPVETHATVLAEFVQRTSGAVLELGMGDGSTPLLHEMCKGRELVSLDNNREWVEKFAGYNADGWHILALVKDWVTALVMPPSRRWSLAFVDQAPGESRAPSILALRDSADYIIVHDTEPGAAHLYPGVEEALASFTYREDYRDQSPHTTVVSMRVQP